MRYFRKWLSLLCAGLCVVLCLAVPFLAGAAESGLVEVTDEPLPSASSNNLQESLYPGWIDYGMGGARFYLVEAAKDTTVYAAEADSPEEALAGRGGVTGYTSFVKVKAGDPLLMCYHPDYSGFGDDEWICVVLEPELSSFRRGYVRAEDLKKNEEGSIARKKLASHTEDYNEFDSVWSEDGPVPIYAGEEGGEVIGTLQEGIVLPELWDSESREEYGYTACVLTYDGAGYIYDRVLVMTVDVEYDEEEIESEGEIIPGGEEGGDVQDGTPNTPIEDPDEIPDEEPDEIPDEGEDLPDESVDVPKTGDAAPAAGLALLFGLALCAFGLKKARAK